MPDLLVQVYTGESDTLVSAQCLPDIMLGIKSLCPGASRMVNDLLFVLSDFSAMSMVTPCSLSDSLSSMTQAKAKDPLPTSFDSFSYLCMVRWATLPTFSSKFPIKITENTAVKTDSSPLSAVESESIATY